MFHILNRKSVGLNSENHIEAISPVFGPAGARTLKIVVVIGRGRHLRLFREVHQSIVRAKMDSVGERLESGRHKVMIGLTSIESMVGVIGETDF